MPIHVVMAKLKLALCFLYSLIHWNQIRGQTIDQTEPIDFAEMAIEPNSIDINYASRKDLMAYGLFSDLQIKEIMAFRKAHGHFYHAFQLQVLAGFPFDFVQEIEPYILIRTTSEDHEIDFKNKPSLKLGILNQLKTTFGENAEMTPKCWFQSTGNSVKLHTGYSIGNPILSIQWIGQNLDVIGGNFRANFGMGLATGLTPSFWQQQGRFNFHAFKPTQPYGGTSGWNTIVGVGALYERSKYAHAWYGGYKYEDLKLSSFKQAPLYSGYQLMYQLKNGSIGGLLGAMVSTDTTQQPTPHITPTLSGSGKGQWNMLSGQFEMAIQSKSAIAMAAHGVAQFTPNFGFIGHFRRANSIFSNGISRYSETMRNAIEETAYGWNCTYAVRKQYTLNIGQSYAVNTDYKKYSATAIDRQFSTAITYTHNDQNIFSTKMAARQERKDHTRDYSAWNSTRLCHYKLSWRRNVGNHRILTTYQRKVATNTLARSGHMISLTWTGSVNDFSWSIHHAIFDTDDYATALWVKDRYMPGASGITALYGQGWRVGFWVRQRFENETQIHFKANYKHQFFQNGFNPPTRRNQFDLTVLMILKWE